MISGDCATDNAETFSGPFSRVFLILLEYQIYCFFTTAEAVNCVVISRCFPSTYGKVFRAVLPACREKLFGLKVTWRNREAGRGFRPPKFDCQKALLQSPALLEKIRLAETTIAFVFGGASPFSVALTCNRNFR